MKPTSGVKMGSIRIFTSEFRTLDAAVKWRQRNPYDEVKLRRLLADDPRPWSIQVVRTARLRFRLWGKNAMQRGRRGDLSWRVGPRMPQLRRVLRRQRGRVTALRHALVPVLAVSRG